MDFLKKYRVALSFLLLLVAIVLYVRYQLDSTKRNGIYTVAKIMKWEPAESGSDLYIDIYLSGKIYHSSLGDGCRSPECLGRFFFVKVLNSHPTHYPILLDNMPVPDCILKKFPDFPGWEEIPKCNDNWRFLAVTAHNIWLAASLHCIGLALNKNIFVVRLGRRLKEIRRPAASLERCMPLYEQTFIFSFIYVDKFLFIWANK